MIPIRLYRFVRTFINGFSFELVSNNFSLLSLILASFVRKLQHIRFSIAYTNITVQLFKILIISLEKEVVLRIIERESHFLD